MTKLIKLNFWIDTKEKWHLAWKCANVLKLIMFYSLRNFYKWIYIACQKITSTPHQTKSQLFCIKLSSKYSKIKGNTLTKSLSWQKINSTCDTWLTQGKRTEFFSFGGTLNTFSFTNIFFGLRIPVTWHSSL